jgi:hypothetical protein
VNNAGYQHYVVVSSPSIQGILLSAGLERHPGKCDRVVTIQERGCWGAMAAPQSRFGRSVEESLIERRNPSARAIHEEDGCAGGIGCGCAGGNRRRSGSQNSSHDSATRCFGGLGLALKSKGRDTVSANAVGARKTAAIVVTPTSAK